MKRNEFAEKILDDVIDDKTSIRTWVKFHKSSQGKFFYIFKTLGLKILKLLKPKVDFEADVNKC